MPAILDVIKGNRILETMENYPIAFTTVHHDGQIKETKNNIFNERNFWYKIIENPNLYWDTEFDIGDAIFTYWVPRVPGFIFTPAAKSMRNFAATVPPDEEARLKGNYHVYMPAAKSAMISGGFGTLKLPSDSNYNVMGCISFSADASNGIPLLISDEVKQHHKLTDGCIIKIKGARWRQMSVEWASKFSITGGIPRGYMVIDRPEMILKSKNSSGILIQPFTIMEQQSLNGYLYDYVYVTVNAADKDYRKHAVGFFDEYHTQKNHLGEYLLAIDPTDPYFDARYILPKDLEEKDQYGKSQMNLMKERIKGASFKGVTLETLAIIIPQYYTKADEIYRLAQNIGVPKSAIPDDASGKMTIVLLEKATTLDKISLLVECIVADFPDTLKVK